MKLFCVCVCGCLCLCVWRSGWCTVERDLSVNYTGLEITFFLHAMYCTVYLTVH